MSKEKELNEGMTVELVTWTPSPFFHVSLCAGVSHGKIDMSEKRVDTCFRNGHMSVFEHASVTFDVRGISRACSHQLVRHRMASYTQLSQRYVKVDTGSDWYVTPPSLKDDQRYKRYMDSVGEVYSAFLVIGVKPEDARYVLPEATRTNLVMTMNWREIFHFLDLRTDKSAQWEIRELAGKMIDALNDQWDTAQLIEVWEDGRKAEK